MLSIYFTLLQLIVAVTSYSRYHENKGSTACVPRRYGQNSSIVCVCNADYCDSHTTLEVNERNSYYLITSNMDGLRFDVSDGYMSTYKCSGKSDEEVQIKINSKKKYQEIGGFGAAFTDSAGINILSLTEKVQDTLLRSYFGKEGLNYKYGRVPMAATDFSDHMYTYADVPNDDDLKHFKLTKEDTVYKIPLMKKAQELSGGSLNFLAAAWSAPRWMKRDYENQSGYLNPRYYDTWAKYHLKFLDAYKKEGIKFWAVSTGNEPTNGIVLNITSDMMMNWTPEDQATWLANNLGPVLENSSHRDVQILLIDERRTIIPDWVDIIMSNKKASHYASGVAVHWYEDKDVDPIVLDKTHSRHEDLFILYTEACTGIQREFRVALGSWRRGEKYASSIISNLNHWSIGWMDWNLALDTTGGPNWIKNEVDAPIITNSTANEFYKQPMYYVMGHFSKYVIPGSVRIDVSVNDVSVTEEDETKIEVLAVQRPDGSVAAVLLNKDDNDADVVVVDKSCKRKIRLNITKRSINTLVYL